LQLALRGEADDGQQAAQLNRAFTPCASIPLTSASVVAIMRLAPLLLVVATACSKVESPRQPVGSSAPVQTTAPQAPQDLLFLPSSVTKHLGSTEFVIAIDFTKLDLDRILSQYPPLACIGDLIKSLGVGAMSGPSPFIAFGTNLTEPAARKCFDQIDRDYGGKTQRTADGSYQIGTGKGALFLSWRDGIAILRENLAPLPPEGPLLPELVALSKLVPRDAVFFFIVAHGWPDKKIKNAVMWVTLTGDAVNVVFRVEGLEPGVVGSWLHELAEGFKEGAAEKHVAFDDKWIKESVNEPVGTIEARFPFAALAALIPLGR
jgi:hypothetical protein